MTLSERRLPVWERGGQRQRELPAAQVPVVLADGARQQLANFSCCDPVYRAVILEGPRY